MHATLFSILGLLIAANASPVSHDRRDGGQNRAAYILDNDPAGASVISMKIGVDDGLLSSPVRTRTGGNGLYGKNAKGDAGPDSLFSQDAVVVEQDYLFVVNAGSHTLSMFFIDEEDPWHPKLVGEPADTLGEFPQSVAYSSEIKTACVLNGGAVAGVTCFSVDHAKGLTVQDKTTRSLGAALKQTTPPFGPLGTASDIFFNPSGTALFATIKGIPPTPGTYFIWPVVNGQVSTTAITHVINDMLVPFGSAFLGSDSELLVTDASFGASILKVTPSFDLIETAHTIIPGQGAICWGIYGARFNSAYIFDVTTPNITVLDPVTGAVKGQIDMVPSSLGAFDSVIDRTWLYVLGGDDSVEVIDLLGSNHGKVPTQVQKFDLTGFAVRKGLQGLAIYPSS